MKKLIALVLCILLLAGCAKTYDGPTKTVPRLTEYTVDHYYSFFDWEEQHYTSRTVYAYDIYGNRVREMEYRDDCTIQYNYDGTKIVTTYNADGSEHYRYYTDSTDHITKSSMCYYTEIQVPAEEVSP